MYGNRSTAQSHASVETGGLLRSKRCGITTKVSAWLGGQLLLAGTVAVSFGFIAGIMYLVQSWRLKHKLPPQAGFKLPSLEWLQDALPDRRASTATASR